MKISRILHAGYVFEEKNSRIAFDPIFENPFSTNCFAFPSVEFDQAKIRQFSLDAVFISHYHDDHCSLVSLDLIDRMTPIYIYCEHQEILQMIRELQFQTVIALELGETVRIKEWEITPWSAIDPEVDCVFQVRASGINILNVVDSWMDYATVERLTQSGPWDLILWPFQTMRELEVIAPFSIENSGREVPAEWIEQIRTLKPSYLVPSSCQFQFEDWSWYNRSFFPISYHNFKKKLAQELPRVKTFRLEPASSVVISKSGIVESSPLNWMSLNGTVNSDYFFDPPAHPPSTSEIARNFSSLSFEQTKLVEHYLKNEIVDQYSRLNFDSSDDIFGQGGYWILSVYDHHGRETRWAYHIKESLLKLVEEAIENPIWKTEIPIKKLFGAIQEGEALTSLYVRVFHQNVLADPLIRCLYSQGVGSYQRAQLKRLKRSLLD